MDFIETLTKKVNEVIEVTSDQVEEVVRRCSDTYEFIIGVMNCEAYKFTQEERNKVKFKLFERISPLQSDFHLYKFETDPLNIIIKELRELKEQNKSILKELQDRNSSILEK